MPKDARKTCLTSWTGETTLLFCWMLFLFWACAYEQRIPVTMRTVQLLLKNFRENAHTLSSCSLSFSLPLSLPKHSKDEKHFFECSQNYCEPYSRTAFEWKKKFLNRLDRLPKKRFWRLSKLWEVAGEGQTNKHIDCWASAIERRRVTRELQTLHKIRRRDLNKKAI